MIGLIQHILFKSLRKDMGEEVVCNILRTAGLPQDTVFSLNEAYPDEEWQAILAAVMVVCGLSPAEVDDYYANAFYHEVLDLFPAWFAMSKNSYELITRQIAIHNNFAAGLAGEGKVKVTDKFRLEKFPNKVITHYRSPNKHCGLYKCLAQKVAAHYGDKIKITETTCMLQQADECEMHIEWQENIC